MKDRFEPETKMESNFIDCVVCAKEEGVVVAKGGWEKDKCVKAPLQFISPKILSYGGRQPAVKPSTDRKEKDLYLEETSKTKSSARSETPYLLLEKKKKKKKGG